MKKNNLARGEQVRMRNGSESVTESLHARYSLPVHCRQQSSWNPDWMELAMGDYHCQSPLYCETYDLSGVEDMVVMNKVSQDELISN